MDAGAGATGATSAAVEIGTSLFAARTMNFAADADDFAYFGVQMPLGWDVSEALVVQFVWSGSATGTVMWGIAAVCLGDSDLLTTAFPSQTTQIDTGATIDDIYVSPEFAIPTIANATKEEYLMFEVSRDTDADANSAAARLHGIKIHYTIDKAVDE